MKNLLTAGLLLLSLTACRDRQDENTLPPATQTGANTAGCLVDGKVWVATQKFLNVFDNYAEINGNICKINLTLKKNPDTYANSIIINFETENLQLNKALY